MSRKPITQQQFDTVITLTAQKAPLDKICSEARVKPTTVNAIRRAKTFAEFERRKALKVARNSAERAMKPAPRPVTKPAAKRHSDTKLPTLPLNEKAKAEVQELYGELEKAATENTKPKHHSRPHPQKGVARRQGKAGVTEQPISAHLLNEAYEEVVAMKAEILQKIDLALDTAEDAKLQAKGVRKLVEPLVDRHNKNINDEISDVIDRSHKASRSWWKFWGAKR